MHSKRGKEVRLEHALPKVFNGPKAYLKRGKVRKHTTREIKARRRTKKEVWLENALPKGSKALKRTQKEVWLENALPKVVDGPKAHLKRGKVRKDTT